ncbi:class I SAM-dependent methyltransferase [Caldivirga maquilingensis]|uniref:Methyltransferase type 11 n=1 Tax=Caldivirga maquilingensis (strain ATCC 700844 / DSM 13496 / JCM 10307 / IC-167) TaxID=397948 RepID=A8MC63_CALMQ|nr:class I SAM-dependent methyltransferase [Caldivirga maquilingensis]ABW01369.1 Methyltransferase type 11 [Caldivirga maquilingensis IC-167]
MGIGQDYGYFEQFDENVAKFYKYFDFIFYWAYRRVFKLLRETVKSPARVLEIGPGTGRLANMVSGLGYHVVGVDVSLPMVKQARRFWRPDFINGGSWRLPLRGGSFDAAVAVFTMHHWGNNELSVVGLRDSLKPDGVFIVAEVDGDRISAHGHSCTVKCINNTLSPYFTLNIKKSFPLVLAVAKRR